MKLTLTPVEPCGTRTTTVLANPGGLRQVNEPVYPDHPDNPSLAPCDRCGVPCGRDDDGLEVRHSVPCGRVCELVAHSEDRETCNGRCKTCRRIITECGGIDDPCKRTGCSECGVHAAGPLGDTLCQREPPSHLCAWTWDRVTCAACLALQPRVTGGSNG